MSAREHVAKALYEAMRPGGRWIDLPADRLEAWGAIADVAMAAMPRPYLTFDELRETNARRRDRWHTPDTIPWLGVDWSNAMGGECGEAQNVVKKLRRIETGTDSFTAERDGTRSQLIAKLGDELADTIAYAALLADYYGIDLPDAIARKFNHISEREGFPERLPRRSRDPWLRPCCDTYQGQAHDPDCELEQ